MAIDCLFLAWPNDSFVRKFVKSIDLGLSSISCSLHFIKTYSRPTYLLLRSVIGSIILNRPNLVQIVTTQLDYATVVTIRT